MFFLRTVVPKQKQISDTGEDANITDAAGTLHLLKNGTSGHDFLIEHAFLYNRMDLMHIILSSCR